MGVRGLLYAVRTRDRTLWVDAGYGYQGEYDRRVDPNEERMRVYTPHPHAHIARHLARVSRA